MKKTFFLLIVVLILAACSPKVWEKTPNGLLIHLKPQTENGARTVSLQVINDDVIRVMASPTKQFSTEKSLCVVDQTATPTNFEVTEQSDTIVLSTAKTVAKVSVQTGAVV